MDSIPEQDKIAGYAKFIDNHTLQVDDHTRIHAKRIVIATVLALLIQQYGMSSAIALWSTMTSLSGMTYHKPSRCLVRCDRLELGQSLHRLGVKVKVFGLGGQVGPLTDPDVMLTRIVLSNKSFILMQTSKSKA